MHNELALYNEAMSQSLADKLFFLDLIEDAAVFVDFGCANGAMLREIAKRLPNAILFGIDNNPMQISLALASGSSATYADDFELVRTAVTEGRGKKVAIFSSVLHEDPDLIEAAVGWADYIVIRDMGITTSLHRTESPYSVAGPLSRSKAFEEFVSLKMDHGEHGFDEGSLGGAAEFLLKVPYLWDLGSQQHKREFSEAYPLVGVEEFLEDVVDDTSLAVIHFEHYSLPYIRRRIRREFGFDFPYPTHFKLILQKVS